MPLSLTCQCQNHFQTFLSIILVLIRKYSWEIKLMFLLLCTKHNKDCWFKFSSQTLVKSLFGILGQTLSSPRCGTVPTAPQSAGRGTWEAAAVCSQNLLDGDRLCLVLLLPICWCWAAHAIDPHSTVFGCFTFPVLWFLLSSTLLQPGLLWNCVWYPRFVNISNGRKSELICKISLGPDSAQMVSLSWCR